MWYLILREPTQNKLVSHLKVTNNKRVAVEKIRMMTPPKGSYQLELLVKCASYLGCDVV